MTTNQRRLIAVAAVMALTFGIVPVPTQCTSWRDSSPKILRYLGCALCSLLIAGFFFHKKNPCRTP